MSFLTETVFVRLNRDGARAFHNAVRLLLSTNRVSDRVSSRVVEDCVRREVARLYQSPRSMIEKESLRSASPLIHELSNYPVETCRINFPVFGLEIFPHWFEINIGNVVIYCLRGTRSKRSEQMVPLAQSQRTHRLTKCRTGKQEDTWRVKLLGEGNRSS